ncbi:MAG: hypothetical protein AAFQ58_01325 [Pseudomonadota bacterium]
MRQARFIKATTDSAKDTAVEMPWSRGKRRAAFISKRRVVIDLRRTA